MLISLSLNDHNLTIPHKKILPLKLCASFLLRKARTHALILARLGLESTVELTNSRTELAAFTKDFNGWPTAPIKDNGAIIDLTLKFPLNAPQLKL